MRTAPHIPLLTSKRLLCATPTSLPSLLEKLDRCHSPSALPTLQTLHTHLSTLQLATDPSIAIKLMRAYSACGRPSLARQLFDQTPHRTTVFFNVMIRGYVLNRLPVAALLLFSDLTRSSVATPDNYSFPCALKACADSADLAAGAQIHGSVSKVGLDTNLFVGNSLITMYARCGKLLDAHKMFDGMSHRDVVSWNSIISGLAQGGESNKALEVCREMVELNKSRPDAGTLASVLPAMMDAEKDDVEFVRRRVFDEEGGRNLISWNAMIAIYANNGLDNEAVELFLRMEREGVEPDAVTLASVLPSCGVLSALSLGKKIHRYVDEKRMWPNLVLENALLDMYAKCGCIKDARGVFDRMRGRDVVSWTAIISAYGLHGHGREAIMLFEQMLGSGLMPDHIALVSVLSACSYSGLLDEGKHYFGLMTDRYELVPRIEHFVCMVDLLGRAGRVEEAYDFIRQMPIAPNERVWGALLGACRVHSNMSIGLVAADQLFKLVPEQGGYYVLLSNIYARAGRWEDVTTVRRIMESKGIKKLPGCSNVELRNRVHTFHVGDKSHPQTKEIYAELDALMARIKEGGYVAETEAALHDVEEEDKEGHLSVHSEKLAVAFMMINTGPEVPIRITMNLRTCGDCHYAIKLISRFSGREIVLRDTNRFHHFEHGVCSCGDYW